MNELIRLLVVDDHEVVREGLRVVFEHERDVTIVGEAGSVREAKAAIVRTRPDVVLLDIQLLDGSGLEISEFVRREVPETACLVLTAFANDDLLQKAIEAGAAGFVLKQINSTELVSCVRRVAQGETLLDEQERSKIRERVAEGQRDPKLASLSQQERVLLAHMAAGLTNREIAVKMCLSEKTIRNYVSSLLLKLGVKRRSAAAAISARNDERSDLSIPDLPPTDGPIRY